MFFKKYNIYKNYINNFPKKFNMVSILRKKAGRNVWFSLSAIFPPLNVIDLFGSQGLQTCASKPCFFVHLDALLIRLESAMAGPPELFYHLAAMCPLRARLERASVACPNIVRHILAYFRFVSILAAHANLVRHVIM